MPINHDFIYTGSSDVLYLIRLFLIIQNLSKRNWIKIAYNNSNIYVNYSMFMRDYKIVDYIVWRIKKCILSTSSRYDMPTIWLDICMK